MLKNKMKVPKFVSRIFWDLHSISWDQGRPVEKTNDIVSWINKYAVPPGNLLDVGCGTGQHSISLANQGWCVTGLDFSESMLKRARKKCHGVEDPPLFRKADLDKGLPFSALSFDCVLSISVIQCLAAPYKLFSEIYRVINPGGYFFLRVKGDPTNMPQQFGQSFYHKLFSRLKVKVSNSKFVSSFDISVVTNKLLDSGFILCEAKLSGPWIIAVGKK